MTEAGHTTHPLDALWQGPVIIWVLLAGEALAAILALAPGGEPNRWVLFGLASLAIHPTTGRAYVVSTAASPHTWVLFTRTATSTSMPTPTRNSGPVA